MRASILIMPSTVANSIAITIGSISAVTFSTFTGIAVPDEGLTLSLRVMKNESGDSAAAETQSLGTITRDNPIIAQTATFSNPDESARYVVEFYRREPDGSRRCFKTRGEYTNAEVNLKPNPRSFTKWQDGAFSSNADLPFLRPGPSGCFAVARTRQDHADCPCNGTLGGTRILAGQTQRSQEARRAWGCADLSN